MNTKSALLLTLFFTTTALTGWSDDAAVYKSHPDSSKWAVLVKEDFSNVTAKPGVWTVTEGVFTASEDQAIWSDREYDNFTIDLEFKTADGSNSGVIVYCSDKNKWIPNSVEIQVADDFAEKWAKSPATWRCGAVFGHQAASESRVKKPGEWNRYSITCKDTMIYVVLNGALVNEFDMSKWTSAKKNPDGSDIPPWLSKPKAELPTKGFIGLQGKHAGAPIFFRNMRIREIK